MSLAKSLLFVLGLLLMLAKAIAERHGGQATRTRLRFPATQPWHPNRRIDQPPGLGFAAPQPCRARGLRTERLVDPVALGDHISLRGQQGRASRVRAQAEGLRPGRRGRTASAGSATNFTTTRPSRVVTATHASSSHTESQPPSLARHPQHGSLLVECSRPRSPLKLAAARRRSSAAASRPSVRAKEEPSSRKSLARGGPSGRRAASALRDTSARASATCHGTREAMPRPRRRTTSRARLRGRAAHAFSAARATAGPDLSCRRLCEYRASARSRFTRARCRSSSGPTSAVASSPSTASKAPAWRLASAAVSARSARRAGSAVSATERCRKEAAAARPPRACA